MNAKSEYSISRNCMFRQNVLENHKILPPLDTSAKRKGEK